MVSEFQTYITQSAHPETTELRLERLLGESPIRDFLNESDQESIHVFIQLISISNFLFNHLCREPENVCLIRSEKSQLNEIDKVKDIEGLRQLKYRELLRITSLDIAKQLPYEEILLALSHLADAVLVKLLQIIETEKDIKLSGEQVPFTLFAMGKLGARELNYSSDVDLICVCANNEDIDSDVHEYHAAVVERLRLCIRYLEEVTATGFLYRVDLNLRPWGRSSPLFMPVDDTENYYEASTEAWERFAWLRARYVAGSESVGEDMLQRLKPFTYRKVLGLDDLEKFVGIKNEMTAIRKKEGCWNVKMGGGGIRDIEFYIQVLQIVNAKLNPSLQQTNTMNLLSSMVEIGLVDADDAERIRESYLFLRRLENRLQMIDEQQVHDLPDETDKRTMIARSLGFNSNDDVSNLNEFNRYLETQKTVAKNCFDKVLLKGQEDEGISNGIEQSWHQEAASSSIDRWLDLCEKNQWHECPRNIGLLVKLFGASWYFTRFTFHQGKNICKVVDSDHSLNFDTETLIRDFSSDSADDDQELQIEKLKTAKNEVMLNILLAQIAKKNDQKDIERALTYLAEATLHCTIQILAGDDEDIKNNIGILAMGRMAGYEMNFGSDLDLIFLYRGGSQELAYKISSFVRKLMRIIALPSPAGSLYEVDMRLRPHGNSGVLVISEESFINYHKETREVWERQMMTRCRAVIDNDNFAANALEEVTRSIYQSYEPMLLRDEIIEVRALVVDELGSKKGKYDLKRGVGGIMDIDFITHYLQLLHGSEDEALRLTSTREAVVQLSEKGLLGKEQSETLLQAYNYLKTIESHLRVFDMKSISTISKEAEQNIALARSMGYLDPANENNDQNAENFLVEYQKTTASVRKIYNELLETN